MNKFALFTTAAAALMGAASTAHAGCTTDILLANESDRLFNEQSLVLPGNALIVDGTLTCDHLYVERWEAMTSSDTRDETDWTVGGRATSGRTTIDGNLSLFELYGDDAYRVRGTASYQLTENVSASVNVDAVWGGFKTKVLRGQLRGHWNLFGPIDGNVMVGASIDEWSEDLNGQFNVGLSARLAPSVTLNAYYAGFEVLDEGRANRPGESDASILGVSLAVHLNDFPRF